MKAHFEMNAAASARPGKRHTDAVPLTYGRSQTVIKTRHEAA